MPVNLEKLPESFIPETGKFSVRVLDVFWVFVFRVAWSWLPPGRSRSKRRDGFPLRVSDFRSSLFKLEWSEVFWVGLDFSSGCLVAGQFGKTAGKFYPGGRKAFDPILIVFWVFPFRVVWGFLSPRKIRSKSRNGFPHVCVRRVVSGFRLSSCKLVW